MSEPTQPAPSSPSAEQAAPHARTLPGRLLAANIALLAVLAGVTFIGARDSLAQFTNGRSAAGGADGGSTAPGARPRGEYTMIPGRYQGSTTSAVYILDVANQELVALSWDRNKNRLEPIGYRHLPSDAKLFRGSR